MRSSWINVVLADWIFFGLAGASLFVFRRTHPLAGRPEGTFRTLGFPFVPGLFVAVSVLIVGSVLRSNPVGSGIGLVLLLTGIPAFWYWSGQSSSEALAGGSHEGGDDNHRNSGHERPSEDAPDA